MEERKSHARISTVLGVIALVTLIFGFFLLMKAAQIGSQNPRTMGEAAGYGIGSIFTNFLGFMVVSFGISFVLIILGINYPAIRDHFKKNKQVKIVSENVGQIFENSMVEEVHDFGAFVEVSPGIDGLLPSSEMTEQVNEGGYVTVKGLTIDVRNRLILSMKAVGGSK